MASRAGDSSLTGISVAYNNDLQEPKIKLSKKARKAARQNLQPFGMSKRKKRIRPSDPAQNNPNDIGAIIIPQGQGPM
jgi:hypothetical protein